MCRPTHMNAGRGLCAWECRAPDASFAKQSRCREPTRPKAHGVCRCLCTRTCRLTLFMLPKQQEATGTLADGKTARSTEACSFHAVFCHQRSELGTPPETSVGRCKDKRQCEVGQAQDAAGAVAQVSVTHQSQHPGCEVCAVAMNDATTRGRCRRVHRTRYDVCNFL